MAPDSSRTFRIKLLLVIDTAFFFLELIVGYSVGSLALLADSFHMLNDVCSLLVALYAIKLANSPDLRSHEYSYGWQRAEVLGALINGVFLLALCFSILLEAIQRIFAPVGISNAPLVVVVGSLGLASNVVGLLLFHEHGHAHGGGHSHSHSHTHSHPHPHSHPHSHSHSDSKGSPLTATHSITHHQQLNIDQTSQSASNNEQTPLLSSCSAPHSSALLRQHSSESISSYDSTSTQATPKSTRRHTLISVHPAQTRNNILRAAEQQRDQLTHQHLSNLCGLSKSGAVDSPPVQATHDAEASQSHHHHSQSQSHSHSHMNMRGIFLHALGDALGNVGVILTGILFCLLSPDPNDSKRGWVVYADPAISLVITAIIFTSALPLVKSASLILLQGTPSHVDLGRVQKSLAAIEGVLQVHELHIWSLSELKLVASVHVLIQNQNDFVSISSKIRKCLHHYGIHSSTIQPEIVMEDQMNTLRLMSSVTSLPASAQSLSTPNTTAELANIIGADGCLQQCDETCDQEACCPPGSIASRASVR